MQRIQPWCVGRLTPISDSIMYTGTQSIWIPANKNQVYDVAKTYPSFVRFFFRDSRIIRQSNQRLLVKISTKLLGLFPTRWYGKGVKNNNQSIRFTQSKGLFKGLTAVWTFNEENNGTVVSIRTQFTQPKIGTWGERFLGKFVIEKTTRKILSELQSHLVQLGVIKVVRKNRKQPQVQKI